MKRRVLIAKALAHEPTILFLDEPTAGVDVELRKRHVGGGARAARQHGVTIILTTHYIEEAEEMADRVGVINKGELILVEDKTDADAQARQEAALARAARRSTSVPAAPRRLQSRTRAMTEASSSYTYDTQAERTGITALLKRLAERGIDFKDLDTSNPRSKTSSSVWSGARDELPRASSHLHFEMARAFRTLEQSIVSPVLSTSLYFIVFGAAIGSRIAEIDGVSYGAFIVPGLIMLSLLTQSDLQRLVRHLFSALHRHDLRTALGADLAARDRPRLCRRGGD